ncbi:class I lanthipeptide [uncultured Dokdonia sp.]|uniref:class I lanthipeptide n=1 Tax=uncultured Dokdonia sp. TaxID=575653 RepID=UPI0026397746|nr:class I lanthipeptide [uncultured Dokdonia sp.]
MKKKKLKSLSLNKMVISKLQQTQINGGVTANTTITPMIEFITDLSNEVCLTDTCISTVYDGPVKATCANC